MNAQQFIKDHGVDKAREVLSGAPDEANFYCHESNMGFIKIRESFCDKADQFHTISISDLKRIVDSVELVNHMGGIAEIKRKFRDNGSLHGNRLKQAIADYESIGGEHV